jgi:tetratricopeptide (TPR) repeat protein
MMRQPKFFNETRGKLLLALVMAATAAAIACAPTTASASLSDHLVQKIAEARRAAHNRNFDAALAVYESAMKMDHATPAAMRVLLKHRSELFEQINLFKNAEADLTEAFNVTPSDATAYADRGYFYMRRARYNDALGDFVTGSRLDPQNPLYMYAAARSLVAMEDFAGAVKFYTEAIKIGPFDGKLYLARAEALLRMKRWTDALADYDRAENFGLKARVDNFFLHAGRGFIMLSRGDYQGTLAHLDRALAIDPDATNVLMWRGYAQERRGNAAAALRDYERVAQLSPDDKTARESTRRVRAAQR